MTPKLRRCRSAPTLDDTPADAVLLIGDRGMTPVGGVFEFVWDLGEEWSRWTGLPFVFSLWVARPGVDLRGVDKTLAAARDVGLTRLAEIARREAPADRHSRGRLPLVPARSLGVSARAGGSGKAWSGFSRWRADCGLAPADVKLTFYQDDIVVECARLRKRRDGPCATLATCSRRQVARARNNHRHSPFSPMATDFDKILDRAISGRTIERRRRARAAAVARSGGARPGGRRRHPPAPPRAVPHVQRRPQHQLHERLHERLPLLRVLAQGRRRRRLRHFARTSCTGRSRRPSPWAATRFCCKAECTPI